MRGRFRIIFGIVLLLGAMALGYVGYAQWVLPALENDGEEGDVEDADPDSPREVGPLYHMPEILTDLRKSEEGYTQYISMEVALECDGPEAIDRLEEELPRIKDALLEVVRSRAPEELRGDEGMRTLRTAIMARVNALIAPEEILEVYFTSLMIQ